LRTGTLPGGSGEQAKPCQPLDAEAQDRLIRAGGGQADPDALLEFIDAGSDLDQAQADRVELGGEVAALDSNYPGLPRFAKAAAGLVTYIENNAAAIPSYGERRHCAEPISTAFGESTVNLVVARRFAKKQQMQWSKAGAHRLLQTRARTLDGTLRDLFTTWYPAMTANDTQILAAATAA
jgi:hypothetical protein